MTKNLGLTALAVALGVLPSAAAFAALPTLSIADGSGLEGDLGASFIALPVTLSAPSATDVTVHAAAGFGTTTSDDQKPSVADLTIPAGQTSATFFVAVFGDTTVEPDETFTATLSDPVGATIARGTATGTILNDDALGVPVATIANVQKTEGNAGATNAVFTVTLAPAPTAPVTVAYETQDGTATVADGDYVAATGTLSFAAGEATKTFTVAIQGDTRAEPTEIFFINLENPTGAKVGGLATGTIVDDDVPPTLSIGDVSVNEGGSGTTPAVFTVTLSAPWPTTLQLKYELTTRPSMCDQLHWISADDVVTPVVNVVTIAAGQTSAQLTVLVNGDTVAEPDELFYVVLAPTAVPVKNMGKGTIINDDGPPPVDSAVPSSRERRRVDRRRRTERRGHGYAGRRDGQRRRRRSRHERRRGRRRPETGNTGGGGAAGKAGGAAGKNGGAGSTGAGSADAGAPHDGRPVVGDGPPTCSVVSSGGSPRVPLFFVALALGVALRRRRAAR